MPFRCASGFVDKMKELLEKIENNRNERGNIFVSKSKGKDSVNMENAFLDMKRLYSLSTSVENKRT
jgi:hypothetical protein